jgi:hypothetical protein
MGIINEVGLLVLVARLSLLLLLLVDNWIGYEELGLGSAGTGLQDRIRLALVSVRYFLRLRGLEKISDSQMVIISSSPGLLLLLEIIHIIAVTKQSSTEVHHVISLKQNTAFELGS